MDRKLKTLLKGAGLEHLVGGARRDTADDDIPPETPEERAASLERMEKLQPGYKAGIEKYNKDMADRQAKMEEDRRLASEQRRKDNIVMMEKAEANKAAQQVDFEKWMAENHPEIAPNMTGKLGDTNIYTNEGRFAQEYLLEKEQEATVGRAPVEKVYADIKAAKQKLEELKANPPKPTLKDFLAFGLPSTATFDQLVAAVAAARAKGELSQDQKNYGSAIVDNYLRIKDVAEANPKTLFTQRRDEALKNIKQMRANLGLPEDASAEAVANARAMKAKESNITAAKQKKQEELYQQWQGIERSENYRIREALVNVRNEIQSQMKDKDKIDRLPYRVMFQEILNNEISRKQIYELQGLAYRHGLETPEEFVDAVNSGKLVVYKDVDYRRGRNAEPEPMPKIVLFDAAKATEEYKQQLENEITWQEKAGHYLIMGSILLTDIAAELLPYAMPLLGTALSLGWKAFAPEGSLNYQEGTIGQKFGRLGLSIVEDGVKRAIGFGKTRSSRRKAMKKLMDDEVKLHGGSRYSLTPEGSKQYNAWSNSNISKEVITLTELNRLKTILTEGSNIPPDTIQNIVLEFGIEWNKGIAKLMNLLDEDDKGKTGVKIGIPPQPIRKRASGKGRAPVKKR